MKTEILQIYTFLKTARKLQHTMRYTPQPYGGFENDAEHSWAVAFTCMLLASRIEKELGITIDQERMLKMALLHDFAEIETGDTKPWDRKAREGKEENERAAMYTMTESLPEDLKTEFRDLWEECEARETVESKVVKSLDRLDPVLHRTIFEIEWKGNIEEEQATIEALDARQLPRHAFSKVITELFEEVKQEGLTKNVFKK